MASKTDNNRRLKAATERRLQLLSEAPAVRAMEQLFQKLDDVLFCLKDHQGRYLWANDAFLRRAKISDTADLLGLTAAQIFPELLAASYEQQDSILISKGRETHDRLEMITNQDGTYGWFLSEKVLVRGKEERILAIAGMSRDLHAPAESDPRLARLAAVLEKMRKCYSEPLRIALLASEAGLSTSRLERLMRGLFRLTSKQYLTKLRIEAAADLLRDTEDSIASIAFDCGFCDQSALCRHFRTVTGTTAANYRKLARSDAQSATLVNGVGEQSPSN